VNRNTPRVRMWLHRLILKTPYFGPKLKLLYDAGFEPGHFYSPIPDLNEIRENRKKIFEKNSKEIPGINLNHHKQVELLHAFAGYYSEFPFDLWNKTHRNASLRYNTSGAQYTFSDVVMLYSVLRHFKPARIVEVGSGYSSAVMLDVIDLFLDNLCALTCIDPDISRLKKLLRPDDEKRITIHQKRIQDTDLKIFDQLKEHDILFIDSSHVSKTGSDLNHLMFEVIPRLAKGVLIHFHDIHYPFELPEDWVLNGKKFWNENYLVRAFLMYNNSFSIINFNTYLNQTESELIEKYFPGSIDKDTIYGSLWLLRE